MFSIAEGASVSHVRRSITLLERFSPAAALLAVFWLWSSGCATSHHVETKMLEDGTTVHRLENNEIKVEGAAKYHAEFEQGNYAIEKRIILDVESAEHPDGAVDYALLLTFMGADALNLSPGRSLEMVADLNSYVLSAEASSVKKTRDPSGHFFTETLRYPVRADLLDTIAEAEAVQVIVRGRDGDARGYFDEKNFADFRRFVAERTGKASGR